MTKTHAILVWVLQHVGFILFYVPCKVLLNLTIEGGEYIEKEKGPYIIASNHVHEVDPILLIFLFSFFSRHFPVTFVTNPKEKYKTFGWRGYIYGGAFFEALGGYAVYSGQKDYAYALSKHEELLKTGYSLMIFPEGKRTQDGSMGPARGGLGYLMYATSTPVLPVAIDGLYGVDMWKCICRRRKVTLRVGEPILLENIEPTKEGYTNASQYILDQIQSIKKQS